VLTVLLAILLAGIVVLIVYGIVCVTRQPCQPAVGAACRIGAPTSVTAQLSPTSVTAQLARGAATTLTVDPTMPAWVRARLTTDQWKHWIPLWVKSQTQTAAFWSTLGVPAAEQRLELYSLYTGTANKYPLFTRASHPWPGTPDSDAALALDDEGPMLAWPYVAGSYGWTSTAKPTTPALSNHVPAKVVDQLLALDTPGARSMVVNPGTNQMTSSWAAAAAKAQGITFPATQTHDVCTGTTAPDDGFQFSKNMGHVSSQIFHQICLDGQARVDAFRYRYGVVGGSFSDPRDSRGNGSENIDGMSYVNHNGDFTALRDMWAIAPVGGVDAYVTSPSAGKPKRMPMPAPVAGMPLSTVDLVVRGLKAGKTAVKAIPSYVIDALTGKTPAASKATLLQGSVDPDNLVRWLGFCPERQRGPATTGAPPPNTFVQRPTLVGPTAQHCFGDEGGLCTTYEDALHEDFTEGLRACRWGHSNAKGFNAYGAGVSDACLSVQSPGSPFPDAQVPSVDLGTDWVQRYWETKPTLKPVLLLRTVLGKAKVFNGTDLQAVATAVGDAPTRETLLTKGYGCTVNDKRQYDCPKSSTGGEGFVTSSNGNITTSRLYGSSYIEVTAKFADASQVVNAIWTFTAADGQPDAPWMPSKLDGSFTRVLYDNAEIDIEMPSNAEPSLALRKPDLSLGRLPTNIYGTYQPSGYTAVGAAVQRDDRLDQAPDGPPSAYGSDHGATPGATHGTPYGSAKPYGSAADYQTAHPTGANRRRLAAAYSPDSGAAAGAAAAGAAAYQAHYSPIPYCGATPCPGYGPVDVGNGDTVTGFIPMGVDDAQAAAPIPGGAAENLEWCCPNATNTINYNSYSSSNNNGSGSVGYVNIPLVAPGKDDDQIFGDGQYHTYGIEWHAGGAGQPAVIHWFQDGVYQASSNVFVPYRMGRLVIGSITTGGRPWTWSGIASNFNNASPDSAISDVHVVPLEDEADYYTPQSIDQALQWRVRAPYRIAISISDAFDGSLPVGNSGPLTEEPVPDWAPYWGMTDLEIDSSAPSGEVIQGFKIRRYSTAADSVGRPTDNFTPTAAAGWKARVTALQSTASKRQGVFVVPTDLTAADAATFARLPITTPNPRVAFLSAQSTNPLDDRFRNPDNVRARCQVAARGDSKLQTYADLCTGGPCEADTMPNLDFSKYKQLDNPFSNDDLQDATTDPTPAVGVACTTDSDCPLAGKTFCDAQPAYQFGGAAPPKQCELLLCGDPKSSIKTDCTAVSAETCCGTRVKCSTSGYGSAVCIGSDCPAPTDKTKICVDSGLVTYGYPTNDYIACSDFAEGQLGTDGWHAYIGVDKGVATWVVPTDANQLCPGADEGAKAAAANCPSLAALFDYGNGYGESGKCKFTPAPVCSCFTEGTTAVCPAGCPARTPGTDPAGCACTCSTIKAGDHKTQLHTCQLDTGSPCTNSVQCSSGMCGADGKCAQPGGSSVCPCFAALGPAACAGECETVPPPADQPDCKCQCVDITKDGATTHGCLLKEGAPCKKYQCRAGVAGQPDLECKITSGDTGVCAVPGPAPPGTGGCSCGSASTLPGVCPAGACTDPDSACSCTCVYSPGHDSHQCQIVNGSKCDPGDHGYTCASQYCDPATKTCQPKST
jgi:hypothetical protein